MLFIIENALWKQSNTSSLILPVAVAVDVIVALVRELRAQFPHWEGGVVSKIFSTMTAAAMEATPRRKYKVECGRFRVQIWRARE